MFIIVILLCLIGVQCTEINAININDTNNMNIITVNDTNMNNAININDTNMNTTNINTTTMNTTNINGTNMNIIAIDDNYFTNKTRNTANYNSRICFIIMTSHIYLNTRVKWQLATFFQDFNRNDLYYISCKSGPDPWIYGYHPADCGQDHDRFNKPSHKYLEFYKNMNLNYDFYVYIDDDTYVFIKRLRALLTYFDKTKAYYMGNMVGPKLHNMHGGSGFVLTKPTYLLLRSYVIKKFSSHSKLHVHGDTQTAMWIKEILSHILTIRIFLT